MNIYADLFLTFSRIGLFTFGGGLAMLPMLEKEVVTRKHWATNDELIDYYAIGQCTPGIIAINTATFIGYSQKKTPGAIVATAGVVFPSLVVILLIASLMTSFADQPIVQHSLAGIRIAVCVLIAQAIIRMFKSGVKDWYTFLLFVLFLVLSSFSILSATIIVILAAIAGIAGRRLLNRNSTSSPDPAGKGMPNPAASLDQSAEKASDHSSLTLSAPDKGQQNNTEEGIRKAENRKKD